VVDFAAAGPAGDPVVAQVADGPVGGVDKAAEDVPPVPAPPYHEERITMNGTFVTGLVVVACFAVVCWTALAITRSITRHIEKISEMKHLHVVEQQGLQCRLEDGRNHGR
jgi:hypothetical protein